MFSNAGPNPLWCGAGGRTEPPLNIRWNPYTYRLCGSKCAHCVLHLCTLSSSLCAAAALPSPRWELEPQGSGRSKLPSRSARISASASAQSTVYPQYSTICQFLSVRYGNFEIRVLVYCNQGFRHMYFMWYGCGSTSCLTGKGVATMIKMFSPVGRLLILGQKR